MVQLYLGNSPRFVFPVPNFKEIDLQRSCLSMATDTERTTRLRFDTSEGVHELMREDVMV